MRALWIPAVLSLATLFVLAACEAPPEASPRPDAAPGLEATAPVGAEVTAGPPTPGAAIDAGPAEAGARLAAIRARDELVCGVNGQLPGFGFVSAEGEFSGFDVDLCRAVAAAVLGDAKKVSFRPLTTQERFTALQTGEIDILARNTTWTVSRDADLGLDFGPITFYDGQGIMVGTDLAAGGLEGLAGASICVQSGTTTEKNLSDAMRRIDAAYTPVVFEDADQTYGAYDEGRCDAVTSDKSQLVSRQTTLQDPSAHVILDVTLSKEPLGPAVLQGDSQWADIVRWVGFGLVQAEEFGITADGVDGFLTSEDPEIRRFLGVEEALGGGLGLDNDFMVTVIRAVGNYAEIYDRNLGPDTPFDLPRGPNRLWSDGGLLYAPPYR